MNKLLTLLALPAALALGACEMRDKDRDGDVDVDRTAGVDRDNVEIDRDTKGLPEVDVSKRVETERDIGELGRGEGELEGGYTKPARGEGELEGRLGQAEPALTNQQVITQFQAEIAKDPDIQAVSANVQLIDRDGDLVLTGTVATDDMRDTIEDYAQKLADRQVNNELKVDSEFEQELAPKLDQ